MTRKPRVRPDEAVRAEAVETITRNIVVTAGAGTGKTTLLVTRMLHLLLGRRLPIREVVALTFTEKAANEMRVRVGEKLREVLIGNKGEAEEIIARLRVVYRVTGETIKQDAAAALRELVQAQIGTIHSFAAHLLRLYPVEARVDPGFVVDEGPALNDLFAKEWAGWLQAELRPESPQAEEWLRVLDRTTLASLEELARALADFAIPLEQPLSSHPSALAGEGEVDGPSAQVFQAWCREVEAVARRCNHEANSLRRLLDAIAVILRTAADGARPSDLPAEIIALVTKNRPTAKTGWTPEDFSAAQTFAKRRLPLARSLLLVDPALLRSILALLRPFASSLRQKFLAAGFISFDGLLTKARDLLRSHSAVREELKRSIRAILVDEFQDTDPLQYEILLFLAEKAAGAGTGLEPGKLFIVGDPKQCIYTFRRADIAAYERVAAQVAEGRSALPLTTSFRSHRAIVDAINVLFDGRIIVEREGLQPRYLPIDATREPTRASDGIELILVTGRDGPLKAEPAREAEAEAIVAWLKRNAGDNKTFKYQDIALLFRTLGQASPYLEAFKHARLPYVVEGEKTFYSNQEVLDLINLLRAIENPHDAVAVAGFLRSPFAGLTDRELYELAGRGLLDYRKPIPPDLAKHAAKNTERTEAIRRLYATLVRLHDEGGRRPVPEVLSLIFHETVIPEVMAGALNGEQRLLNLFKLQQLATDLSLAGEVTLKGVLARLHERVKQAEEEGESPLADETQDAVKVLTIHKAKGLEFPVAILPNLHREIGTHDTQGVWAKFDWMNGTVGIALPEVRNLQSILMHERETAAQEAEERRVLYVAMTRAKDRLILTGSVGYKPESPLGLMADAIKQAAGVDLKMVADGRLVLGQKGSAGPVITVRHWRHQERRHRRAPATKRVKREAIRWEQFAAIWQAREARFLEASHGPLFVSPTHLIEQEEEWWEPHEPGVAKHPADRAALIGSICHRVLEVWNFSADARDLEAVLAPIVRQAVPPDLSPELPAIAAEAAEVLRAFFASGAYDELKTAEILGREVPLLLPWNGQLMQGVIDVLYRRGGQPVAKHGDRTQIVVADYKTDQVTEAEMAARAEQYAQQQAVYTKAVASVLGLNPAFRFIFLRVGKALEWPV